MITNARKSILPLTLAVLFGGCQEPTQEYVGERQIELQEFQEDLERERQGFMLDAMKNGWVSHSQGNTSYSVTLLPIDYEYNWKYSEDINGVWTGIEGSIGASIIELEGSVAKQYTEIGAYNYVPFNMKDLIGDSLPEGHSIVSLRGYDGMPSEEETFRMLDALEEYVSRHTEELGIGLDEGEMNTLRKSVEELVR